MAKTEKKDNTQSVEFGLEAMFLLSSTINSPDPEFNYEQDYGINYRIDIKVSEGRNIVRLYPKFYITDLEQKVTFAEFSLEFRFGVKGSLDEILPITDKGQEVNRVFATTLNSIAYSTSRGVIFMALKGTHLHRALLPLINPSAFTVIDNPDK